MFFKPNFHKKHTGFSKIELLVVIAVLTILVLLAVPQLLGYTRQAETTRLLNNGEIIESAVAQYKIINEEWPTAGVAAITPSIMSLDGTMIHRDNPEIANKTFYVVDRIRIDRSISRIDDTTRFVVDEGGSVYILNLEHIGVTGVRVDTPSLVLLVGESADANASIEPANASVGGVTWETSNSAVAAVDENGVITALAAGQAIISAHSLNYLSHGDTITVTVLESPTAIITMTPSTNINTTTNVTFTHNTTSNGVAITGAEWQVNSEAIVPASSLSRTFPAGNYTVRLRVQDANGTWSEWVSAAFDVVPLPVAIITMTPSTNINTTTSVTFTHNTESNGVAIASAEWQVNSEAIVTTSSLMRTFSAGSHTIRLRVQDVNGLWSEWASTTFDVVPLPVATITMTPSTNINTTTSVTFTHNTESNGVAIASAEWQVNSEAIVTTSSLMRTFSAGSHTIRLRVQDVNGLWSEWTQITVSVTETSTAWFYNNPGIFDSGIWASITSPVSDGIFINLGRGTLVRPISELMQTRQTFVSTPSCLAWFFGNRRILDISFRAQLSTGSGQVSRIGLGDTFFIQDGGMTRVTVGNTPISLGTNYAGHPRIFRIRISAVNFNIENLRAEFFIDGALKHTLYGALTGGGGAFVASGHIGTRFDWVRIDIANNPQYQ